MSFNNPPFVTVKDLAGLQVTVMGLGLNGGGLASARFFASHGALVTVTDMKSEQELAPSVHALSDHPGIRFVLGSHELNDFTNADLVIKNPGVKLQGNRYLEQAKSIESDVSVFLRLSPAPILAVTGSKGKSSTVSALHFGMKKLGYPVFLGGNITVSPLTFLEETTAETPVILELSSWQLADLRGRGLLKPRVALITPIMSDHQNWYGSMGAYVSDKKLIYADMEEDSVLLCNADDGWGAIFASETRAAVRWYTTQTDLPNTLPAGMARDGTCIDRDGRGILEHDGRETEILPADIAVPGTHMRQNLVNAAHMMVLFGADPESAGEALASFPGIEHRLEFFHEDGGVRFYNDSAATIPEAAAAAAGSFGRPVILLSGGTDKDLDFEPLADVAGTVKRLLLLAGTGTDKLVPLLRSRGTSFDGPYPSLEALAKAARAHAEPGDIVVFSPGATSFGMFRNEFDRGRQFKALFSNNFGSSTPATP